MQYALLFLFYVYCSLINKSLVQKLVYNNATRLVLKNNGEKRLVRFMWVNGYGLWKIK